ncbi:MAG: hypothetical protein SCI25_00185 [Desulfuromonadales bacterium]|nr:hypothetical protein [Desulfuromonadales bacterium]
MSLVLQLREQLDRLKRQKIDLSLRADANVKAAKELLSISAYSALMEIDLKTAAHHLSLAIRDQEELEAVLADIRKIERELGA